jgi:4-amino-4-deoxy-L-arabinose transferase-like glycosyltransferase
MKPSRALWLLLVLSVCPAVASLADEIPDVDPAQYADVAARVLRTGRLLALEDLNGPFINKPPLMMWAQAGSMALVGVDSFGARLPALLFALLVLAGTWLVGRELGGPRLGAVAAVLAGASVALHHMVADPKVDLPLTAMTTLAIWAVLASRRHPVLLWVAWGFAGLAVLSKGPIGLVIPVLALGPEWLRGALGGTTWRARLRAVGPLRGFLVLGLVAGPFYVSMALRNGGGAAGYLLWKQGFGRLIGQSGWADQSTSGYFLHTSLWAFAPFSPLLVATLARRALAVARSRSLPPALARVTVWWFTLPFVVVSASDYKLPQYIYWLLPPAALLAAEELLATSDVLLSRWRWFFGALAVVTVPLCGAVLALAFPGSWAWLAAVAGACLAAWALTRGLEGPERTAGLVVSASVGVMLFFHAYLHPAMLEYQAGRRVGLAVRTADPEAKELWVTPPGRLNSVAFYAQRDVPECGVDELAQRVREGKTHLSVVDDAGAERLRALGLSVKTLTRVPSYNTSLPRRPFLDATTREGVVGHLLVVQLSP